MHDSGAILFETEAKPTTTTTSATTAQDKSEYLSLIQIQLRNARICK